MRLIKEIRDRHGKLYFRRWRILTLPFWFFEMHEFFQDDEVFDKDGHLHNHPNEFWTLIWEGGYVEVGRKDKDAPERKITKRPISLAFVDHKCFHRVHSLIGNYCKTFILKKKKSVPWGYLVDGQIVGHEEYRANKNPKDPGEIA